MVQQLHLSRLKNLSHTTGMQVSVAEHKGIATALRTGNAAQAEALLAAHVTRAHEQLATRPISDAVPELVEQALRNAGAKSDNVTVISVEWESAEDTEAPGGITTDALGDEVFASTIQASLAANEAPAEELDDAEIERSIREINEAIKRSSQKKP